MTDDCGQLEAAWRRILDDPHPPRPWRDGNKIPWHDSDFSERMLGIHLDQQTHMASRTREIIGHHVGWLHERLQVLTGADHGLRVLDVGCGPGLYCHELARRGHTAVGFDFAPAPLRHAREVAEAEGLDCAFHHADLTVLDDATLAAFGETDAVTFWFGEFNSFAPDVARRFLARLASTLKPGGLMALEVQPYDSFARDDLDEWQLHASSPLCDGPHFWLQRHHWDEDAQAEITVYWILDARTGELERFSQCHQAWRDEELVAALGNAGLDGAVFEPPITGCDDRFEFSMVTARKSG
ncbi:class I SAM-dependent methyltransferase [bacterium]|nr:class I SAM-dependent methyltransferase [bacterium]